MIGRPAAALFGLSLALLTLVACMATKAEDDWLDLLLEWSGRHEACGESSVSGRAEAEEADCGEANSLLAALPGHCSRLRLPRDRCESDLADMREYADGLVKCRENGPGEAPRAPKQWRDCMRANIRSQNKFRP